MTGSSPEPISRADAIRSGAYRAARRHSARVRWLKIAIPVGAVAASGLVALVSLYNPFGRIPGLTMGPISLSGTKIAMQNPRLTGYRKDSRPYEVTATVAFQDVRNPGLIELKDMRAKLRLDVSGNSAELSAKAGLFDSAKEHLDLKDDIRITTSRGEEVLLRSAAIDMKAGTASSSEPVTLRSPSGTIEAAGIAISDGGSTIAFTGRVRTQFDRMVPAGPPAASPVSPRVTQADPSR